MNSTSPKVQEDAVFVIDGSGYIFRAYFAIRQLSSSKGVPTNAVYGFTTMLLKLIKTHNPKYLVIAFDRPEKTFRHKMYPDYKANRPAPPEDLIPQFDLIHRLVKAFRIPILVQPGLEADDLIGSIVPLNKKLGKQTVVVTGDKDLMQLVDDEVFLLDELRAARTGTEQITGAASVIDKFGVPPSQVIDVLALAGDVSDNVPGVRGIGEKTAAALVKEYGSVENILAAAPSMKKSAKRERLMQGRENALLSKELVTIKCDVPLDLTLNDMLHHGPNKKALLALFEELEFKTLLRDPYFAENGIHEDDFKEEEQTSGIDRSKYELVTDEEALASWVQKLKGAKRIAIDTETTSLDPMQATLVGISLSHAQGQACYIPVGHKISLFQSQLPLAKVIEALDPIFQDTSKIKIGQNGKYDYKVLTEAGFKDFTFQSDPMIASYLLEADTERHNLNALSERHLGHTPIPFEAVCGKGRNKITFDEVPLEDATQYAAEDADLTFRLSVILEKDLRTEGLMGLYADLEIPLATVLGKMEKRGILLNPDMLGEMSVEFDAKLKSIEKNAHQLAGQDFNLASPKQVGEILFDKLQLPVLKKTKTGPSTDSSVLEKLAPKHELPRILLEFRSLSKLKGTYVDALPRLINPKTGRVHTSYNQAVAATGRLSSSDPNLQNIPIRSPEGKRIREAFVAKPGHKLLSLDYSQVELRILAHMANDPVMIEAFNSGDDVHRRTASEIFDVSLEKVSDEQRRAAKAINFGLMYGMGPFRLAENLGISRAEAKSYVTKYHARYSGIYNWQKSELEKAHDEQQVTTLFGRRRKLPEFASSNRMIQQRAERVAINTPIQGTSADLIKMAMIEVDRRIENEFPAAHMLLQVHDELVLEVPDADLAGVEAMVREVMSGVKELKVPLVVDAGVGNNWREAH